MLFTKLQTSFTFMVHRFLQVLCVCVCDTMKFYYRCLDSYNHFHNCDTKWWQCYNTCLKTTCFTDGQAIVCYLVSIHSGSLYRLYKEGWGKWQDTSLFISFDQLYFLFFFFIFLFYFYFLKSQKYCFHILGS